MGCPGRVEEGRGRGAKWREGKGRRKEGRDSSKRLPAPFRLPGLSICSSLGTTLFKCQKSRFILLVWSYSQLETTPK